MRVVIQRVTKASVTINGQERREIGRGYAVLVGVGKEDTEDDCSFLSEKIVNLRLFPNEQGKFDTSLIDMRGELLVVSQFTLYGDCRRGRRPDFTAAERPEKAISLYQNFVDRLRRSNLKVETGEFGADMLVEIHNDGPVTLVIDSKDRCL